MCVHPLLCVIVKKQCHLDWNRERVGGFLNINHMVDLFTEARWGQKGLLQLQENTRQIIVPLDLSLKIPFPIPYPNVLQLKKALLGPKCLVSANKCTV